MTYNYFINIINIIIANTSHLLEPTRCYKIENRNRNLVGLYTKPNTKT